MRSICEDREVSSERDASACLIEFNKMKALVRKMQSFKSTIDDSKPSGTTEEGRQQLALEAWLKVCY